MLCPCYAEEIECDPMYCKKCFNTSQSVKSNNCYNENIYFNKIKRCVVAESKIIPGLGLHSVNFIPKNSFIMRYIGEKGCSYTSLVRSLLQIYIEKNFYEF